MELIAKARISGKVRLKVDDKVVSETTLAIKKRRDIELLPDFVTLRFDPATQEFRKEKCDFANRRIHDLAVFLEKNLPCLKG